MQGDKTEYSTAADLQGFVGVISREKRIPVGRHFGFLRANGIVAELDHSGARFLPLDQFMGGFPVRKERAASPAVVRQAEWRAHQLVANPPKYDLLTGNCEHFANAILGDEPRSRQIEFVALVAAAAAFAFLKAKA